MPPEVSLFIATHPPGRVLDLGCGTGTSSIGLARAGWQVTGVDFSIHAIRLARKKAKLSQVMADFRIGDVTRLGDLIQRYELILDIGCFHNIAPDHQAAYLENLNRLLLPGGNFMLYGLWKSDPSVPGPGLDGNNISELSKVLKLISRQDGKDRERASAWFIFQKAG